jgi:hypothetical protein
MKINERRHRILSLAKQETGAAQTLARTQILQPTRGKIGACERLGGIYSRILEQNFKAGLQATQKTDQRPQK